MKRIDRREFVGDVWAGMLAISCLSNCRVELNSWDGVTA